MKRKAGQTDQSTVLILIVPQNYGTILIESKFKRTSRMKTGML